MTPTDEHSLRRAVCDVGQRLYARNMVAATDGNITVRLGEGRFLCTPSGVSKGFMDPDTLPICDATGQKLSGEGKITSEVLTHLVAYEERPDMHACVHAHPPSALALMIAGFDMSEYVIPEVVYSVGSIPMAPYSTPATPDSAEAVRDYVRLCDAVLMERHGALTLGISLMDAYLRMEKLEHAAQCLVAARLLGGVQALAPHELDHLRRLREVNNPPGRAHYPE